ncbi:MAG: condensation domain-containing protein [Cyanobacteria bacterium J06592_8]
MSLETLHKKQAQTSPSVAAKKELWEAMKTVISLQNQAPPFVSVSRENSLPLSFPQQRLWFLQQLNPSKAAAYNMPFGFRISGSLNLLALEQSLNEIIQRHEGLRTTFSVIEGEPTQVIHDPFSFHLSVVNVESIAKEQQENRVMEWVKADIEKPISLTQLPLFRGTIFQLSEQDYFLLLNIHHIIIDAWSKGVLFQELATLYKAFSQGKTSPLSELSLQYADFSVWQRQCIQGEFKQTLLNYWQRQLGEDLQPLKLLTDHSPSIDSTHSSAENKLLLPAELITQLKSFSRKEGATLFATLLAAFKVLLYRYTEQDNFFVCSPIANRSRKETKGIIGYFVNLLILRTQLNKEQTFREYLSQVRQVVSGGFAHQDLPIQEILNELNLLQTPLSKVMFALQNTTIHTLELSGLEVETSNLDSGTADFDLYLYLIQEGDTFAAIFKYNADLFEEETIAKMQEHYRRILENILINPEQSLCDVLSLSETEQQKLEEKRAKQSTLNSASIASETPYISPRNSTELKLAQLWSQVLGIESIGVRDNFFDLGGKSLMAMSLFTQIEQTFGKTLPLTTLLNAPTIEKLAEILAENESSQTWSSLVPLQPHGSKPPFFCIHGQQGNVLNLRELAQSLSIDQPFYGLQAQGLDGKQMPYFTIEEMATHYLAEIRTVQPHGPYFLGGNSMGGTIAFEMAQQLEQQGEKVAVLVMFDTFNKNAFPRLVFRKQHYLKYLSQLGVSKLFTEVKDLTKRQLQVLFCKLYLHFGKSLPHHLSRAIVAEANMQAKWAYKPQVYSGKITLFQAEKAAQFNKFYLPNKADWETRDPQHGWGDLTTQKLEIYEVPGDHYSIFDRPNVQVLAETLKACLK